MRPNAVVLGIGVIVAAALVEAASSTQAMVDPAVAIQQSLALDTLNGVPANAARIGAEAVKLGRPAAKIAAAAKDLEKAKKLTDARAAFGRMSEALIEYFDAQKTQPGDGIRVAFCPMANKPWLQHDGVISNPYYGQQMLTCGSFKK